MIRFAVTIFFSAFLLFQLQPMIAKFILPWFGGSNVVWTTCLMFFQVMLVAGYAYAHVIHRYLSPKSQWLIQSALVLAACLFLPIRLYDEWKPQGTGDPAWEIILLLMATIGLPFFVLTTSSPLLQAWAAKSEPTRSPYRLYALSNVGSLLALLTYPFWIEPRFALPQQSWSWFAVYLVFALSTIWSGYRFMQRSAKGDQPPFGPDPKVDRKSDTMALDAEVDSLPNQRIHILFWILLPMAASIMLVASTNLLTHEVAAAPFLWIIPLSLYLLTFVICFDHPKWYMRTRPVVWLLFWSAAIFGLCLIAGGVTVDLIVQIIGYSALCFLTGFVCHGELVRLKPPASQLTLFYLMIGIGGALGGIFVAVIAPRIFEDFLEFHVSIFLAILLIFLSYLFQVSQARRHQGSQQATKEIRSKRKRKQALEDTSFWETSKGMLVSLSGYGIATLVMLVIVVGGTNYFIVSANLHDGGQTIVYKQRSPYGVLAVVDVHPTFENDYYRYLINGRIDHGLQFIGSTWEHEPVSYYGRDTGLGLAFKHLQNNSNSHSPGLSIGVVGLGIGITSAYANPGDTIRYYEIDPQVEKIARQYFTHLKQCERRIGPDNLQVVLGDARIQLERDLENHNVKFDLLSIDAFTSDSIPAHLLTKECFELYRKCLTEKGILAVHVSNRYLNLEPIVKNIARALEWPTTIVSVRSPTKSTWVIISQDERIHDEPAIVASSIEVEDSGINVVWTDSFTPILPLIEWPDNWRDTGIGKSFWTPVRDWNKLPE